MESFLFGRMIFVFAEQKLSKSKRLNVRVASFFNRNRACLNLRARKVLVKFTFLNVFDYGDIFHRLHYRLLPTHNLVAEYQCCLYFL